MQTPGAKIKRFFSRRLMRSNLLDVSTYIFLVAGLVWFFSRSSVALGYNWQWYQVGQYLISFDDGRWQVGPLWWGLLVTFKISGISLAIAFLLGLTTAFMRLSDSPVARGLARVYLELVRNTPLLIQIFFIYFVVGPVLGLDRMLAAILALSLFEGAYVSEILRAGIVSIAPGQWEAAHSLGLNAFDTYRYVIMPQTLRRVLPPLTGQAISLVKDSALVSTIAIYDLTMQAQVIIAETFLTFELWFIVAAIYLVVTITLSLIANTMEQRSKIVD
jgi:polar amino acid transport system permease protein